MTDRRMLHHQIHLNGYPQKMRVEGMIYHVESKRLGVHPDGPQVIEVWSEGSLFGPIPPERTFQAFGTGEALPDDAVYQKSVRAPDGTMWHLFELTGVE
ncbi:hypothetical protein ACFW2V_14040 [Streptomyces sp. NPDC058947]|uniref:DUF7352 domain-containing protein n=1 Tax=Streptomyces sp. NPDC058947 TaxID=3346675 RepID=UPI00369001A4